MGILLTAIGAMLLFAVLLDRGKVTFLEGELHPERKRSFCAFAAGIWTILSGLRHLSIGADTMAYGYSFLRDANTPWGEIIRNIIATYRGDDFIKDPAYPLIEKAVHELGGDYRTLLILIAVLFFGSMGVWVCRHSRVPVVSFLLFSTLFYSFFAFTGQRQTIATALVVFMGDGLIRRRKLVWFLLLVLAASTIHKSCICFVPAYFLYPVRNYSRQAYVAAIGAGLILLLFSAPLWEHIGTWLHYESFLTNDIGGTGTYVFLFFLVLAITVVQFPFIVRNDPDAYGTLNMIGFGSLMVAMSYVNQSFMRVQQYYSLYLMLLLPEIILSFKPKHQLLVAGTGCGLLLLFFILNRPAYLFFWQ